MNLKKAGRFAGIAYHRYGGIVTLIVIGLLITMTNLMPGGDAAVPVCEEVSIATYQDQDTVVAGGHQDGVGSPVTVEGVVGMAPLLAMLSSVATHARTKSEEVHQYSLRLPRRVFEEVDEIADRYGATRLDVLRKFIQLGLWAEKVEDSEDESLCLRRNGDIVELKLFF